MSSEESGEVTNLLRAIQQGDRPATNRLFELVYDELRSQAERLMLNERPDHTLQPTALVHEACLRLLQGDVASKASNRAYFFAAAARAMGQILVEHARRRAAAKRGGGWARTRLDDFIDVYEKESRRDLIALDMAIGELEELNPRQAAVIRLRFFFAYSVEEVAQLLEVSEATVKADFRKATAFLHGRLEEDG